MPSKELSAWNPSTYLIGDINASPLTLQILERWTFLEALQIECPEFWRSLHKVQRTSKEEIFSWMLRSGVVDQWFIDVVWDTLEFWVRHPDSPHSKLEDGQQSFVKWFYYSPIDGPNPLQLPLFRPALLNPGPSLNVAGTAESRAEFEARMLEQFRSQLTRYCDQVWRIIGADRPERLKHATWTALAFTGLSYTKIAGRTKGHAMPDEPDKTVSVSVRRFAERISLTIPGRRKALAKGTRS